jgi:hypothetical protein
VPKAEKNAEIMSDLVIRTDIDAKVRPAGSNAPEVLFSARATKDAGKSGKFCFIRRQLQNLWMMTNFAMVDWQKCE